MSRLVQHKGTPAHNRKHQYTLVMVIVSYLYNIPHQEATLNTLTVVNVHEHQCSC